MWPRSATPVRLVGRGLVLRAWAESDLPELRSAFADADIGLWNPGPAQSEADDAVLEWLRGRNDWSAGDHASWAVSDDFGAPLGSVSVFNIDRRNANAEIGYWIAPAARGRRLAITAVDLAAGFAFETIGLCRLYLHHAVENVVSCRVAEATGFRLEGSLRQSYRYADDQLHDEHVHGRLTAETP